VSILHASPLSNLLADTVHAGSTDLARWPLSEVEIRLAAESLHDPDAVVDLYRVCQSKDRCEVARAYVYARLVLGAVGG
jgi:hypothetical protein